MNKVAVSSVVVAVVLAVGAVLAAQDAAKAPTPESQQAWLRQLLGEWEFEMGVVAESGQPPVKTKGVESIRAIGDVWIVAENKGDSPAGVPTVGIMTLGYEPQKKKFVGTWIDSNTPAYLWVYQGTLDAAGRILTLDTEGPSFDAPDKLAKYRDVIELKDKDHKVLTSSVQGLDGKWTTFVTVDYRRKK